MRKNFPVTQVETQLRHDQYLISKTDLKGRITYANPAFIEISGFSREELLGKAHNIVRHPDMPPAGFQDLWDTLKAKKPWLGLVKNRRKDGGYYWVQALVSPIYENNDVIGYASVRIKPSPEQIAHASAFYEKINQGQAKGYRLKAGRIAPTGWRRGLELLRMPFNRSLRSSMFRQSLIMITLTVVSAYSALNGGLSADYRLALGLTLIGGLALYMGYGWRIANRVVTPLENASLIAQQIATGNLMLNIDSDTNSSHNETSQLYFCLELMRKSLNGIASDTHRGIAASLHAADALNASNRHLSERTAHQADSLQQTAASMEELTITVKQNADNALRASQLADNSMAIAKRGAEAVNQLAATMQGIHDSSRQITAIVNLIEGIAFQTNILALNAAVESARAGEAGRGFAVVAGEVRSLAQRSAKAAGEITELINDSVSRMVEGVDKAEQAGTTMQEIEAAVQQVNAIINEITYASEEQAIGLQQINQAVGNMDNVTRENNRLVDNLGSTVHEMAASAQELEQAIKVLNMQSSSRNQAPTLNLNVATPTHNAHAIRHEPQLLEHKR